MTLIPSIPLQAAEKPKEPEPCADCRAADKKLNDTYNRVLKTHEGDKLFLEKLKKSQRAWLAFRDAELEALYPAENKKLEYGTVNGSISLPKERFAWEAVNRQGE